MTRQVRFAARSRLGGLIAAVMLFALVLTNLAQADPRSIQSFVAPQVQAKWKQYVGTTWTLEGRYASLGANQLRFQNCDMKFVVDEGVVRVRGVSNVIEVTGMLELQGDEVIFRVTSSRARPSDPELLRLRRSTIDTSDPKAWYELADWARDRGRFYGDEALTAEALTLYQEGIDAERRQLKPDDFEGRLALAKKAEQLGLGEAFIQQVEHAGLRAEFETLRTTMGADYSSLMTAIARKLPGAGDRLVEENVELASAYEKDPIGTYRLADEETRRILNRLFHLEVVRARVEQMASPDGKNGYELARQLDLQAPELEDLANLYRSKQLNYQLDQVATLTRQELLEFVQRCEARDEHELAAKAKEGWLAAREPRLRQDGARGLVELGEDWLNLTGNTKRAATYFIDAYNANPGYGPASDWLSAHGYVYRRGNWLPATDAEKMVDPRQLAIREGRVEVGMTEADVRAALGSAPSATYRFASSGRISELWIFSQAGIMVRFEHRPGRPGGEVVSVDEIMRSAQPKRGSKRRGN